MINEDNESGDNMKIKVKMNCQDYLKHQVLYKLYRGSLNCIYDYLQIVQGSIINNENVIFSPFYGYCL